MSKKQAQAPEVNLFEPDALTLKAKRLHPDAQLPEYATAGAACFDIKANETCVVLPGDRCVVSTGLSFEVPDGYVMLVYSRSGHGFNKGVRLVNSVGVIDSDYRGEVLIGLHNDSDVLFKVYKGDRIAQAMLMPVPRATLVEADNLSETERGTGGFGSTGK